MPSPIVYWHDSWFPAPTRPAHGTGSGSPRRLLVPWRKLMKSAYLVVQRMVLAMSMLLLLTLSAVAQAPAPAAPKLDSGDTAWMLTSMALVLMMTVPGLALFYGGMVRKMNVLATVMQSFAVACLVTVLWMVIGYSFAFTSGSPFLGGTSRFLLYGM